MTRSEPNVANFKLKFSEHSSTDDGFGGKQSRHRKEPRERLRNKEKVSEGFIENKKGCRSRE